MKKQSFLHGSLILILSAILTKGISALFKIPLTNLLGGAGMGYFGTAYGLFLPIYALSISGLTTAVAKLTAERAAFAQYRVVRQIRRLSLCYFAVVGLLGSVLMLLLARPFCSLVVGNAGALLSVRVLAPAIFIGCISAVYRGYYEGLRNMYPTAVSQLLEAICKLWCGLLLCHLALRHADTLLPYLPAGTTAIEAAAAAAMLGITLSSLVGMLFLLLRDLLAGDGITKAQLSADPVPATPHALRRALCAILIPVAIGSLVTNLTTLIDLATGIRCLEAAIAKAPSAFSALCRMEDNASVKAISNFIFGSFTGLAVTVFNLVPSVTNMFGKSVLPAVAAAYATGDRTGLERDSAAVMRVTAFLAAPAGLGISALSGDILRLLYPQRLAEIAVSQTALAALGIGVLFLALSVPLFQMLQAIGHAKLPIVLMLGGVLVKLAGNLLLIPLPSLHIAGAGISTTMCYLVIFLCASHVYQQITGISLPLFRILLPPCYAGTLCAVTAVISNSLLTGWLAAPWRLLLAICLGGCVYLFAMWLMGELQFHSTARHSSVRNL